MPYLKEIINLDISSNYIEVVPDEISKLINLRHFGLDDNFVSEPQFLCAPNIIHADPEIKATARISPEFSWDDAGFCDV